MAAVEAQAQVALSGAPGATDGATGIPVTVLAAYRRAEANLAAAKPSCHLPWWLVAGVGRVETGHAFGGRVDANGNTRGRIMGPLLDGSMPGTAVIRDTDGGKWDGDATFDRGIGPMGFLPGSWTEWGKDGNGDKVADPNNVFDAATAAGYVLCSVGDLSDPATMAKAVLRYNQSASYVKLVLDLGRHLPRRRDHHRRLDRHRPGPRQAGRPPPAARRRPRRPPRLRRVRPRRRPRVAPPPSTTTAPPSTTTTRPTDDHHDDDAHDDRRRPPRRCHRRRRARRRCPPPADGGSRRLLIECGQSQTSWAHGCAPPPHLAEGAETKLAADRPGPRPDPPVHRAPLSA